MIMGIICLIMFIAGVVLTAYGLDDWNLLVAPLGVIMMILGFVGFIIFISINIDIITSWFKI